jgi:methyl-accepting chemotaxis protein
MAQVHPCLVDTEVMLRCSMQTSDTFRDAHPGATHMQWMSRISVKAKLALLLVISSLGIVSISFTGWYSLRSAVATSEALVATEVGAVSALGDIRSAVGNTRRFEKDLFLNLADDEALTRYVKSWKEQLALARSSMVEIKPLLQPTEQAALQRMEAGLGNYQKSVENIVVGIERGEVNDPWRANSLMEPSKADVRAADSALAEISASVTERVQGAVVTLSEFQQRALTWMLVTACSVLLLSVSLGYLIATRIVRPLQHAVSAMERVAKGDLTHPVQYVGNDETARVLAGIEQMQSSLGGIVEDIRHGVVSIAAASSEIAAGNADLSRRTEQSAAHLEETASSMNTLNSTVQHSSLSAKQARELVGSANDTALRSGEMMGRVVQTMNDINNSSAKISDIVGVIDSIAFQTNILALNAAVEAARAGEQGRGFAVVAAEVRNLAHRSAQAAKEIKALIGASVANVATGTQLVDDTGVTMSELVQAVAKVSVIINDMASAAAEQSNGIGQVNASVNELDQSTQQNAALVEQSTAAAESLKIQAERLEQTVAIFRLTHA